MTNPSQFSLPFLKKEQVGKDTFSFYFDRTRYDFDFLPGQYVRMILELKKEDPRGRYRFFSISSSPTQKDFITITTKITDNPSPFKQQMMGFREGEDVRFFGPLGKFVLPDESGSQLVLLAGGIGITPFQSMMLYASDKELSFPVTLFASFSTVQEAAFYQVLKACEEKGKREVIYTITHPETPLSSLSSEGEGQGEGENFSWQGETGRISKDMIEKYISSPQACEYFICGPQKMVKAMEEIVSDMDIPKDQIKTENFTGY